MNERRRKEGKKEMRAGMEDEMEAKQKKLFTVDIVVDKRFGRGEGIHR